MTAGQKPKSYRAVVRDDAGVARGRKYLEKVMGIVPSRNHRLDIGGFLRILIVIDLSGERELSIWALFLCV